MMINLRRKKIGSEDKEGWERYSLSRVSREGPVDHY